MLTGRKGLAKVSGTPGKTRLINHFLIDGEWYLVDLPGYGFAKMSKDGRDKLRRMIESYILLRKELTNLFVLIDCRHEPQKNDLEFMEWLGVSGVPFSIVFTKTDKLSASKLRQNVEVYKQRLLEQWETLPPMFMTSSEKGIGKEELLNYINEINNNFHCE